MIRKAMKNRAPGSLIPLPAVVYAAWTLALALLLVSGRYTAFLRPAFFSLVAAGALVTALFLLSTVTGNRRAKVKPGFRSGAAILMRLFTGWQE